jgi:hypothetical protein
VSRGILEGFPEFFESPFFDAGYIASGNAKGGSDLPLG